VAREYLRGKTMAIGEPEEGLMVLPKQVRRKRQGTKG
jgi:hypothetical protein